MTPLERAEKMDEEKRCCTVCDSSKVCSVCGIQTLIACSDCRIDFKVSVYVCKKSECQKTHGIKCPGERVAQIDEAEREAELKAKASYEHELHLAHRIVDGVKELNDHQVEIAEEAFNEGFSAAREKAKGIVEEEYNPREHEPSYLADRISKMKPEGK